MSGLSTAEVEIEARSGDQIQRGVKQGARFRFELPDSAEWTITCLHEDFWCPQISVEPGEDSLVLLPIALAATFEGTLGSDGDLPEAARIQGWIHRNPNSALPFQVDVQIIDRAISFRGPAVPMDLRVAVAAFSPIYLWNVGSAGSGNLAEFSSVRSLGRLSLETGSSLCGFVSAAESGEPLVDAAVLLRARPPQVGSPRQTAERLAHMRWEARTNERGFFQLAGAPGGTYRLEIQAAGDGFVPLEVEPLDLTKDAETCLEDLQVFRPVEVTFLVEPPLGPGDRRWQVRVNPRERSGYVSPDSALTVDSIGMAGFRLSPGTFDLLVLDVPSRTRAFRGEFDVRHTTTERVQLDLVKVEGAVRLGDEPLVSKVKIYGRDGFRATFETDFEGRFTGFIPTPGEDAMPVQVDAALVSFSRWLELAEIPLHDGIAQIDLEFEDRTLSGKVLSLQGEPVRSVKVSALPLDSNVGVAAETDVDGDFTLTGLEDQPYRVSAEGEGFGTSRTVRVEPWGDGPGPEVELILMPGREIRGRLVSAQAEPLPGASLTIVIPGSHATIRSTTTDMSGAFRLRVPEPATRAVVQAFAPTQMAWSACVDLPVEGAALDLQVPRLPAGVIRLSQVLPSEDSFAQPYLLTAEGGVLGLGGLTSYGSGATDLGAPADQVPRADGADNGEPFQTTVLRQMASGLYSALRSREGLILLAERACSGAFSALDWQLLTEGGEIELRVETVR